MRFLIDECLHESLSMVAHAAGFDAVHVYYLGLSGQSDRALVERIVRDEFVFVTNNGRDFIELYRRIELHAGLIIIVPCVPPAQQRLLFRTALASLETGASLNTVVEVRIEKDGVRVDRYDWPRE